jgi:hypothetical protein
MPKIPYCEKKCLPCVAVSPDPDYFGRVRIWIRLQVRTPDVDAISILTLIRKAYWIVQTGSSVVTTITTDATRTRGNEGSYATPIFTSV